MFRNECSFYEAGQVAILSLFLMSLTRIELWALIVCQLGHLGQLI